MGKIIYTNERISLNQENIKKFIAIDNFRNIRKTHIERIKEAILKNTFLEAEPIHVNKKGDEYKIIEGNHRIVAIRELLDTGKIIEINMDLAVYNNLRDEEEKQIFDILSKKLSQTIEDYLNLHKKEFLLYNMIEKKGFPVRVGMYGSKKTIKFKNLIYMINATRSKTFELGLYIRTKEDLGNIAKNTTEEDYRDLVEFFQIFFCAYGDVGTDNRFAKAHIIIPLYHIWVKNKDKVTGRLGSYSNKEKWAKVFERLIPSPEIVSYSRERINRDGISRIRNLMIDLMFPRNRNKKRGVR